MQALEVTPILTSLPDSVIKALPINLSQTVALKALRLKFSGFPYAHIATVCNKALGTVKNWFSIGGTLRAAYDAYIEVQTSALLCDRETMQERFLTESPRSLEAVCEVRDDYGSARAADRLAAAKDVLDRAGFAPTQKHAVVSAELSGDDLTQALDALLDGVEERNKVRPVDAAPANVGEVRPVEGEQAQPAPAGADNQAMADNKGGGVSGNNITLRGTLPPPSPAGEKAPDNGGTGVAPSQVVEAKEDAEAERSVDECGSFTEQKLTLPKVIGR